MRIDAHLPEKRKKSYRIIDVIGSALQRRLLYFHRSQGELLEQILSYPSIPHDDRIESLAVAIDAVLEMPDIMGDALGDVIEAERDIPDLPDIRISP